MNVLPRLNAQIVMVASFIFGCVAMSCVAINSNAESRGEHYSPYIDAAPHKRVLFGDTHLHSSWSTDVGMGGASVGPDKAYQAARGDEVTSHSGLAFKLQTPLDFVVVADHAENLGLADFIRRSDPLLLANPQGRKWHDMVKGGDGYQAFIEWLRADNTDLINEPTMAQVAWRYVTNMADQYYQPGAFTTLHGFEWTSHPGGDNMHRVVIFRDGAERTQQVLPYSQYDSINPEDLWAYLTAYEQTTGGRVLAIPHNANLSNGTMFATETVDDGQPIDRSYAETRAYYEPVVEVTQMKGTSESHPLLSPDDAFADFEIMDAGNLSGKTAKTEAMLPAEYARYALQEGLRQEQALGVNPFKFGMIGSTDAHTGLPSSREENNFNKAPSVEPSAVRLDAALIEAPHAELSLMVKDLGASGLAGVWATDNTREAIWDAFARREVFATTGSRLTVRLFAGWDFTEADLMSPNWVQLGQARGVPMGADLPPPSLTPPFKNALDEASSDDITPTLMIMANRDAQGANLDRIQVVKGWVTSDGKLQERVYDAAVSDGRMIDADGRCDTPVGSTVDLQHARYSNTIGALQLATVWRDPDFDQSVKAFYYVRVIEIPQPRWPAYDMAWFGNEAPEGTQLTVQDRAYTSPVWFTPSSSR